jgi:hypothetical protein
MQAAETADRHPQLLLLQGSTVHQCKTGCWFGHVMTMHKNVQPTNITQHQDGSAPKPSCSSTAVNGFASWVGSKQIQRT